MAAVRRRRMQIKTYADRATMSRAAARHASRTLRDTIARRGRARLVAATGASQFEFLAALTDAPGIEWSRVEMFHLDEYVGLSIDHPASFRRYLLDRLITKTGIRDYHLLDGERDAEGVADRIGRELARAPVDVALLESATTRTSRSTILRPVCYSSACTSLAPWWRHAGGRSWAKDGCERWTSCRRS